MTLPSPQEFLAALAADPQAAAAFDAATRRESPGKSRREAVETCHQLATATLAEIELNKSKLAAAKAKIAALEAARKFQQSSMKTPPSLPTKATPQAATVTAASFATPPLIMARAESQKPSPADKLRFSKAGGKLI